ncbi:unnamed protein product [Polarella glacialis]|uniref:Uncharacterized protein n=1 Tax=Polarella glacialis TaxID=89957 RepID=A0A813G030_POLGL|nr:unnamed protein product [Polarella glacialis]
MKRLGPGLGLARGWGKSMSSAPCDCNLGNMVFPRLMKWFALAPKDGLPAHLRLQFERSQLQSRKSHHIALVAGQLVMAIVHLRQAQDFWSCGPSENAGGPILQLVLLESAACLAAFIVEAVALLVSRKMSSFFPVVISMLTVSVFHGLIHPGTKWLHGAVQYNSNFLSSQLCGSISSTDAVCWYSEVASSVHWMLAVWVCYSLLLPLRFIRMAMPVSVAIYTLLLQSADGVSREFFPPHFMGVVVVALLFFKQYSEEASASHFLGMSQADAQCLLPHGKSMHGSNSCNRCNRQVCGTSCVHDDSKTSNSDSLGKHTLHSTVASKTGTKSCAGELGWCSRAMSGDTCRVRTGLASQCHRGQGCTLTAPIPTAGSEQGHCSQLLALSKNSSRRAHERLVELPANAATGLSGRSNIDGSGSCGDCLAPDSLVWCQGQQSPVPLRDVVVGDRVLALDPDSKAMAFVRVHNIATEDAGSETRWVNVRAGGSSLLLTESHPMKPHSRSQQVGAQPDQLGWEPPRGVVPAGELQVGLDSLWVVSWELLPVEEVRPAAEHERPAKLVRLDFEEAYVSQVLVCAKPPVCMDSSPGAMSSLCVCSGDVCTSQVSKVAATGRTSHLTELLLQSLAGDRPPKAKTCSEPVIGDRMSTGSLSPRSTQSLPLQAGIWLTPSQSQTDFMDDDPERRSTEHRISSSCKTGGANSEDHAAHKVHRDQGGESATQSSHQRKQQKQQRIREFQARQQLSQLESDQPHAGQNLKAAASSDSVYGLSSSENSLAECPRLEETRTSDIADAFSVWRSRKPDLSQLLALLSATYEQASSISSHPGLSAELDEVCRQAFTLMHEKSTSSSNRQPFANTVLDASQIAVLRRILPAEFRKLEEGSFESALQQIVLLVLVVVAQESANVGALLRCSRGKDSSGFHSRPRGGEKSVLEVLCLALGPVAEGSCTPHSDVLRLLLNFISEFRVSLMKLLASGLMRGRGNHSKLHMQAMNAQQVCTRMLCGATPGECDIGKRMTIYYHLAQVQPAVLAKKIEGVLREIINPVAGSFEQLL